MDEQRYDVVVIGGGPAGLACGLWMARYRRSVCVIDEGDPRNAPTWGVHGYLGLQDVPPMELRRIGRAQARDAGTEFEAAEVVAVEGEKDRFTLRLRDGRTVGARRVVFATGLRDIIPEIPGLLDCYGTSIWHCPECDGPSVPDQRVGIIGWGDAIVKLCMWMLTWTDDLVVLTHGRGAEMSEDARRALARWSIPVREEAIARIEGTDGWVERVVYEGREPEPFDALFFHVASGPGSSLPAEMGCRADEEGMLQVDREFETSVPGVYAAGDITPGTRLAIRAAYEGTRAAIGIQKSLIPPDRRV